MSKGESFGAGLPVVLPAAFEACVPDVAEMMARLGFRPEQFIVVGEGPQEVCVKQAVEFWSESREMTRLLSSAVFANRWWKKEGDVFVVFSNITPRELLGDSPWSWGVAGELGVAKEKIQATREWAQSERLKVEDDYRATVREFVRDLKDQPAYAALSREMQVKLTSLGDSCGPPDLIGIAVELETAWALAEALHARALMGEVLPNWGGRFRVMGATRNTEYWVLSPDGTLREPDEVSYRKRYTSEGEKWWRVVGPEELAITWSKAFTAADHEFTVGKLPSGGCTPAQLRTVERIESEIAERFKDAIGISGKPSPGVGQGWGLVAKPEPKAAAPVDAKPASTQELNASLAALRAKFGKR